MRASFSPAPLERSGEPLQFGARFDELFRDIRDEIVAHLGETHALADIVKQHDHKALADAAHRDAQPVRPAHRDRRGVCASADSAFS